MGLPHIWKLKKKSSRGLDLFEKRSKNPKTFNKNSLKFFAALFSKSVPPEADFEFQYMRHDKYVIYIIYIIYKEIKNDYQRQRNEKQRLL